MNTQQLNKIFGTYSIVNRIERLYQHFTEDEVLFTSSFGTNSVYLLHLISRLRPNQKVHFIDTGYHFEETLEYKDLLTKLFGLKVVTIKASEKDHAFTKKSQLWLTNPDLCCNLNKVQPLETIKAKHKIWISGLMNDQTDFRANLDIFAPKGNITKFHPIIDADKERVQQYIQYFKLPQHPLFAQGYESIGCSNCTSKGCGRSGRWQGMAKTECGLHPDYFLNKVAKQKLKDTLGVD